MGRARSSYSISAALPTSPMSVRTTICSLSITALAMPSWAISGTRVRASRGMRTALRPNLEADRAIIEQIRNHPFFPQPPPKSSATPWRVSIGHDSWRWGRGADHADRRDHGAARDQFPRAPHSWILAGGRDQTLMAMLVARLAPARVAPVRLAGPGEEAQACAYRAARTLQGAPITFPGTTGLSQTDAWWRRGAS